MNWKKCFTIDSIHWWVLMLFGINLVATDQWFSILEDEATILDLASSPASDTLHLFWSGVGQHEHPPLSDLLLHYWLPLGNSYAWSFRLFSICFYLAGIALLRLCARRLGGKSAAIALVLITVLWPFGFHFGRLVGWYGPCFFLVCALTLAYLRFLDSPAVPNSMLLFTAALALVYTNYFGWAVLGCLLIDSFVRHYRRQPVNFRTLLVIGAGLVLAYTPLWTVFINEIRNGVSPSSLVQNILYGGFNFYSLFVSESVAPWFWALSIPAGIAILALLVLSLRYGPPVARVFLLYFLALFAAMMLAGISGTKRMLMISPWLLLAVSVAVAQAGQRYVRVAMAGLLVLLGSLGWFGIIARSHYSAPHFIEPWAKMAKDAKTALDAGARIVSNSPSFFFYLTQLQRCADSGTCPPFQGVLPATITHPQIFSVEQWQPEDFTGAPVLFVEGVNKDSAEQTAMLLQWLQGQCHLDQHEAMLADTGYAWKLRLFPDSGQIPFRIQTYRFSC